MTVIRRARSLLVAVACFATVLIPAFPSPAAADTILDEGFESAMMPPSGWEDDADPAFPDFDIPWVRDTTCSVGVDACASSAVDAGASATGTGRLNMIGFDTNGLTNPKFEFTYFVDDPDGSTYLAIHRSPEFGDGYEFSIPGHGGFIYNFANGVEGSAQAVSIDLEPDEEYFLRFRTNVPPGGLVEIDNVLVTGEGSGGGGGGGGGEVEGPGSGNAEPSASRVERKTNEDAPVRVFLRGSDPDGDKLDYEISDEPDHGELTGRDQDLTYTPDPNFNGIDAFKYKVTDPFGADAVGVGEIEVISINDPPVVKGPVSASVIAGRKLEFTSLLANAISISDVESDTVEVFVSYSGGTITLSNTTGLTFSQGDGTDDATMRARGTTGDWNAALDHMTITPTPGPSGNLVVGVDDLSNDILNYVEKAIPVDVRNGPDVSFSKGAQDPATGIGVFNTTGEGQTFNATVAFDKPTDLIAWVGNVGKNDQRFTVKAESSGSSFLKLSYKNGAGENITPEMNAGSYETNVSPGFYGRRGILVTAEIVRWPLPTESQTVKITASSATGDVRPGQGEVDVGAIVFKGREFKTDMLFGPEGSKQSDASGNGIYEADGGPRQVAMIPAVREGFYESVNLWVQNDGTAEDAFKLSYDNGLIRAGLDVYFYDNDQSDVTSQILNGTYQTPVIPPQGARKIRMTVGAPAGAVGKGVVGKALLRAVSLGSGTLDSMTVNAQLTTDKPVDMWFYSQQELQHPDGGEIVGYELYEKGAVNRQYISEYGEVGAANLYEVWVSNKSAYSGTFGLQARRPSEPGYDVKIMQRNWDGPDPEPTYVDVTKEVFDGTLAVKVPVHASKVFHVYITPNEGADSYGFPNTLRLEARTLDGLPSNYDTGNIVTSATRFKPDLTISSSGVAPAGGNIYQSGGSAQTMRTNVGSGERVTYTIDLTNDGVGKSDLVRLHGLGTTADGYKVSYFGPLDPLKNMLGRYDITDKITGGSYLVPLSPNPASLQSSLKIDAVVDVPADAQDLSTKLISVSAKSMLSQLDPPSSDMVTALTHLVFRPDLSITTNKNNSTAGAGVINRSPTGQTVDDELNVGRKGTRVVTIRNAGQLPDRFELVATAEKGLSVAFTGDPINATDTFSTRVLAPGESLQVPFRTRIPTLSSLSDLHPITVTARSLTRPAANGDAVMIRLLPIVLCEGKQTTFDTVRITTDCLQPTDDGWIVRDKATINTLNFNFPGKTAFIDKTKKSIVTNNADVVAGNLTVYSGAVDLDLGPADTLERTGLGGMVNGMILGPGPVKISMPTSGPATVELPLRPPTIFSSATTQQVPVKLDSSGTPAITQRTEVKFDKASLRHALNFGDLRTVYDPISKEWIGYGRVGFPQLPVVPGLETALRINSKGELADMYMKLKGEVPITPLIKLTSWESAASLQPSVVAYGKITADTFPTPISVEIPGLQRRVTKTKSLVTVDGEYAYAAGTNSFTIRGTSKLLNFLNMSETTMTYRFDNTARLTSKINYSVDMGSLWGISLGSLGVNAEFDGSAGTDFFQIEGTGTASAWFISADIRGVLSNKGVAGCAGGKVLGKSIEAGFGLDWNTGSVSIMVPSCNFDPWKDPRAPAHADFGAIQAKINDLLVRGDGIRQGMAEMNNQLSSIGLPTL